MSDLNLTFDVSFLQNADFAGSVTGLTRSKLQQESLISYPIDMAAWKIHDDVRLFLPPYASTGSTFAVTIPWSASDLLSDRCNWIAGRDWKVVAIVGRVEVAGTGGACTCEVRKAASATDIAGGTILHSGSFNLVGTVDTNQTLTLVTTEATLFIAAGTCLGLDITGTPTSAVGSITIYLTPASTDDLYLGAGAFGTGSIFVTANDCKTLTTTRYARWDQMIPHTYEAGQDFQIVFNAGMVTTIADGSCTIDVSAYKKHTTTSPLTTLASSDLVTDAATTMNTAAGTFADIAFDLDPATLTAGNILDCRVAIAVVDTATATAVLPVINSARVKADSRG